MKKIIILYVPILHEGYLRFFQKHSKADILFILGKKLIQKFTVLEREIRQIDPLVMKNIIKSSKLFPRVEILTPGLIKRLQKMGTVGTVIITTNETISWKVVEKYFPYSKLIVDSIFLRWDEENVSMKKPIGYDKVSTDEFDRKMMNLAEKEAEKSSDWWRRVGAVLVRNKKIILKAFNHHLPSEHTPYVFGDPRDFIEAGKNSDIATSIHSEQSMITEAAQNGIKMKGASLYITDFPCPMCARELSKTGIKRCYFKRGHASLNGLESMKLKNIKIILVK